MGLEPLRVPLHRQSEWIIGQLYPLHDPIWGAGCFQQTGCQIFNPLVVQAVNFDLIHTQDRMQLATRIYAYGMSQQIARKFREIRMSLGARVLGQDIRVQGAS